MKRLSIIRKKEETIEINEERFCEVDEQWHGNKIQVRTNREFSQKAFYLSEFYDWVLGVDSEGLTILVPLKKEDSC